MDPKEDSFSPRQLSLLEDQEFLLEKAQIQPKVQKLLGEVRRDLAQFLSQSTFPFPTDLDQKQGKISRGENYRHLPYWILDFPRLIHRDRVWTFRSMLWWGNEFSLTLHLQGDTWEELRPRLLANISALKKAKLYLCVAPSPWEYHFGSDNYRFIGDLSEAEIYSEISKKGFLKLSRSLPLSDYPTLGSFAVQALRDYLHLLKA